MSRDVVRSAALDQDAAEIWLPARNSVLLVKTVITTGTGQMFVRLTRPQGAGLPGVTANAEAPAAGVASLRATRLSVSVHDLKEILRRGPSTPRPPRQLRVGWTSRARSISCAAKTTRAKQQRRGQGGARQSRRPRRTASRRSLLVGQVAHDEDDARPGWEGRVVLAPGPSEAGVGACRAW